MAPITLDMLRRRAEHNEGIVSSLEARKQASPTRGAKNMLTPDSFAQEVSLHQQDIEKIEGLGTLCKHLKICLLQNNLISRIGEPQFMIFR